MSLLLFVTISLVLCSIATGFALSPLLRRINAPKTVTIRHQSLSSAAMLPSFNLAEGLDAETLQALSDVNDISDAVADAATGPQSNAVAELALKLTSSQLIIAVPILAGFAVTSVLVYFFISWVSVKDD